MKKLIVLALGVLLAFSASGAEALALKRLIAIPVQPAVVPTPTPPAPKPVRIPLKPGQCLLQLRDGVRIVGFHEQLAALPVQTDFGPVEIPLDQIRQLVASGSSGSVKIELVNGDRLTCKLRLARFTLKSSYGSLVVPVADMTRLAFGDGGSVIVQPPDEQAVAKRSTAAVGHAHHDHDHAPQPDVRAIEVIGR